MKDAKGHGSEKRGAHSSGIDKIAGPEKLVPIESLRPRPENTAMLAKFDALEDKIAASRAAAYPDDPPYQRQGPREAIEKMRADIRAGNFNPPPLAIHKDGLIEDGEHRYRAYKAEGVKHVKVRVLR